MKTIVYENSLRAQSCERLIRDSGAASRYERMIILPIPTSRDGVHITGSDIKLSEALSESGKDTLAVGYGIPEDTAHSARGRGATVIDSSLDEEFLSGNAYLTALGTVGIILDSENRAPSEISFGVVGYGRIGRELVRLLLFLGARVRVISSRQEVCLDLSEDGVDTSHGVTDAALSGLDILINTAPARLFDGVSPECLCAIRIIELASGNNFPEGVGAECYPALPGRVFPESAGAVWGRSVLRLIEKGECQR